MCPALSLSASSARCLAASAAAAEEVVLLAVGGPHSHLTGLQQREQRRVPGVDAEVTLGGRRKHHRRGAREQLALGADDVDVDGGCFGHYCSVFAFSSASSIEPTM